MKIKFIKPFRLISNNPDDRWDTTAPVGYVIDLENNMSTRWLIDNGFAEEVKESGWWKPKYDEEYFYIGHGGFVHPCLWENDPFDNGRLKLGLAFKTEEAGIRCRDYLEAVAIVRQDEGVLTPEQVVKSISTHYVSVDAESQLGVSQFNITVNCIPVNVILFDTAGNARASLNNHPAEWEIIANYDWSRE